MDFEVPPLPYSKDALSPAMSEETLEYHYGKHHQGYMKKLAAALEGTPDADKSLEDIVRAGGATFNNAAQVWNHTFFWRSLKPGGGGAPAAGDVADLLTRDLGGYDGFREQWLAKGGSQFGSGWVWLVLEDGKAKVTTTGNADTPITGAAKPLLVTDVWEHAYYIDHRNDRAKFLNVVLDQLVNWDFVAQNLKG